MARRTALVVDRDLGFQAIVDEVMTFRKAQILIGFQVGTITHSQTKDDRVKPAGLNMAQIASQNEYGTETIPARSFMRTSFDENINRISKALDIQYTQITQGQTTAAIGLAKVGEFVQGLIQQKIRAITSPPNSPLTIAIKKSSKPLIDFGQMIQSVRYKVIK